jgi:hypothetical protein
MNGWKAKTGGIGLILTGLGTIAAAVASEKFDYTQVIAGAVIVFNGLGVFGIRVALDKLKEVK